MKFHGCIIKRLPTLRHLFSSLVFNWKHRLHLSGLPHGYYIFFFFSQILMVAMMSVSTNKMTALT